MKSDAEADGEPARASGEHGGGSEEARPRTAAMLSARAGRFVGGFRVGLHSFLFD